MKRLHLYKEVGPAENVALPNKTVFCKLNYFYLYVSQNYSFLLKN